MAFADRCCMRLNHARLSWLWKFRLRDLQLYNEVPPISVHHIFNGLYQVQSAKLRVRMRLS